MIVEFRDSKTNGLSETWNFASFVPHQEDVVMIYGQSQFKVIKVVWRNQESAVCYVEPF